MDIVSQCNEIYLQMVRQAGGAPGPISRTGAMLHIAMFEVINALAPADAPTYETYMNPIACIAEPNALQKLSAIYAARYVLMTVSNDTHLVPGAKRFEIQTNLDASFGTLLNDQGGSDVEKTASKAFGECIAQAMINARQSDGYNDPTTYPGSNAPGQWRPTLTGTTGVTPKWGLLQPFGQWSPNSKFRPSLPAGFKTMSEMLASPEYAAQLNEVKLLGSSNSTERTDEQTQIGFFWANDLDGTSKPPGQLYTMTSIIAQQRNLTLEESARLFALVGMAMADAAIVAWDVKYETGIDLWRPESAVREANSDGNTHTGADMFWQPLSRTAPQRGMTSTPGQVMSETSVTRFSPPFPAYVSGHATFGAAHAAAMRVALGTDNITFTLTTEDPNAIGVTRTFNSLMAAALENGRSRVYLGVHFQWDGDNGFLAGTKVGEYIASNFLKQLDPPPVPMLIAESHDTAVTEA